MVSRTVTGIWRVRGTEKGMRNIRRRRRPRPARSAAVAMIAVVRRPNYDVVETVRMDDDLARTAGTQPRGDGQVKIKGCQESLGAEAA